MSAKDKVLVFLIGIVIIWSCIRNFNEQGAVFPPTEAVPRLMPLVADSPEHHRRIFILAGQSNMAGRGGVDKRMWDGLVPQECEPNPAILRLSAGLSWEEASEPLHADIDSNKTCGIGPGLVFANEVLQKDENFGAIGLVPCAVGGTSINEWSRGSLLYNNLIARTNVAVRGGGIVEGILWYQGERDTIDLGAADDYKTKLEQLILDMRHDLSSPYLPIIEVMVASAEGPWMDVVREAQLGIGLPNVIKVDARGLPLQPDGLHLSTPAQVRLGQMMADAYLTFRPSVYPKKTYRLQDSLLGPHLFSPR